MVSLPNLTFWYKILATDTLGSVPAAQKILFDDDNAVLHDYSWQGGNNIKQIKNPNDGSSRIINVEDVGFDGLLTPLVGYIKVTETTKATNLFAFLKIQQITTNLPFGRFAIDNPNGPLMSIESNVTKGLSIGQGYSIIWNKTNKSYDFNLPIIFGGTFI